MTENKSSKQVWMEIRHKCKFLKNDKCTVAREPPETCSFDECPKQHFEWISTFPCVLCDFGQCEKCAMVRCKLCNACVCLDHIYGHLETCGMNLTGYAKFRYEQEIIDGKPWTE